MYGDNEFSIQLMSLMPEHDLALLQVQLYVIHTANIPMVGYK